MRLLVSFLAGVVSAGILASPAKATIYNFDMTFDGTSLTLDGGSDTPNGTPLAVGDSFVLNIHAAGSDFWNVVVDYDEFVPLTFGVSGSADRNADIATNWLLDGSIVHSTTKTGVTQAQVHVGAQDWDLSAGLAFDTVVLTWVFNAIDIATSSIIQAGSADMFLDFDETPFFRSASIEYVSGVPLPASLPLMLGALGGLAGLQRWRLRAEA